MKGRPYRAAKWIALLTDYAELTPQLKKRALDFAEKQEAGEARPHVPPEKIVGPAFATH